MVEQILVVGEFVLAALAVLAIAVVLGWRVKSPLVLRPVIALSRKVINPRQLRTAGTAGAAASVIQHRGRISGRSYETPLDAVPVDGGFLIALVYGSRTNWLRNVLANGSATILRDGVAYAVDRPEIVRMTDVADRFAPADRRGFRLLGIDRCLHVRTAAGDPAVSGGSASMVSAPAWGEIATGPGQ